MDSVLLDLQSAHLLGGNPIASSRREAWHKRLQIGLDLNGHPFVHKIIKVAFLSSMSFQSSDEFSLPFALDQ